jgi:hypothetical protein
LVGDHEGAHNAFIAVWLIALLLAVLAQSFLARSMAGGHGHCRHSSLGFLTGHSIGGGSAKFLIFLTWLTIRRQYVGLAVPYG